MQENLGQSPFDDYFTREQLAEVTNRSPRTIDRWHELRTGPPRVKFGNLVLYPKDGVRQWLESHREAA